MPIHHSTSSLTQHDFLHLYLQLSRFIQEGPKRKEKKATDEPRRNIIRAIRQGATVNCGKCKQPGHSARTCTNDNASRFTQSQHNPISEPPPNEGSSNNRGPSVQDHSQLPQSSNASIPMSSSSNSRGRSRGRVSSGARIRGTSASERVRV
ncbi:hypothetical protein AKJ16_DCAP14976 [Drosera capensis]